MKTLKLVKLIFGIVGLAFLAVGYFWYDSTSDFLEQAVTAKGTVTDLVLNRSSDSRTYSPVISFMDEQGNPVEFVSQSGSSPPAYSKGEQVEVLYQPGQPEQAKIDSFFALWGGPLIFGGLGLVFFLISAGLTLYPIIKKRNDEQLRNNGTPIETEFQRVELNTGLEVNGSNPFHIVTQWQNPATSEIHVFKSNNLWYDPTDYINRDRITVFIEQDNPDEYYVDLSFLPEKAN